MLFNATFNNISVISWRSVLLVEETEDPEKTTDLPQVTDTLYHIMLYTSPWSRFELTTSVVIGTDCISSCKANCYTSLSFFLYKNMTVILLLHPKINCMTIPLCDNFSNHISRTLLNHSSHWFKLNDVMQVLGLFHCAS